MNDETSSRRVYREFVKEFGKVFAKALVKVCKAIVLVIAALAAILVGLTVFVLPLFVGDYIENGAGILEQWNTLFRFEEVDGISGYWGYMLIAWWAFLGCTAYAAIEASARVFEEGGGDSEE